MIVCVFDCACCVCRLLSVVNVGCEEVCSGGGEVELMSEFGGVSRDGVVGFGEVDVDGEEWLLIFPVIVDVVEDSLGRG